MDYRHTVKPEGLEDWVAYTVYLVATLYSLSLGFVCVYINGGEPWRGYEVLFLGGLAALLRVGLDGPLFAWCANPLLAVTVVLFTLQRFRLAILTGLTGLLLALSFLGVDSIPTGGTVTGYGLGFYLWLGSCAIPVVASFFFHRLTRIATYRSMVKSGR